MIRPLLAAAILALLPAAAVAQNAVELNLGAGVGAGPAYFGSDAYAASPKFRYSLSYLRLGKLALGRPEPGDDRPGVSFGGSVRRIGARTAASSPELAGLDDIDRALELGVRVGYGGERARAFAALRYGVEGHKSFVGEVGVDALFRPGEKLTVFAGPRAFFGSDRYAATYFGVTPAESAASGLPVFVAEGGLLSVGIDVGAVYRFDDRWSLKGSIGYLRWTGDAADSPIPALGSRGQARASLIVTRKVRIGF